MLPLWLLWAMSLVWAMLLILTKQSNNKKYSLVLIGHRFLLGTECLLDSNQGQRFNVLVQKLRASSASSF
jgi:hypothetical protein